MNRTNYISRFFYIGIATMFIMGPLTMVSQKLPSAFLIGEYEKQEEKLNRNCGATLMSVCNDSMMVAQEKWENMLSDMENYAEDIEFDIKGIKVWIHVFWNSDGTLKNISYYPKPESKNMDFAELTDFFTSFISDYQIDLSYDECYQHYASASFPTFYKLFIKREE